jgi:hypothetical protein
VAEGKTQVSRLHLFGIRHHGPGSARSLLAALDGVDPAVVLIEGPPDADDIVAFAGSSAMRPPVAILVHGQDDPADATFYPFAVYSPEWQAMRWALARGRPARFIDLPAANQLPLRKEARAEAAEAADNWPPAVGEPEHNDSDEEEEDGERDEDRETHRQEPKPDAAGPPAEEPLPEEEAAGIRRDPLAYLAAIAGYEDGEAWWNALIEQSANAPSVFAAIEHVMTELRAHVETLPAALPEPERRIEAQREAHMRLAIAAALKATDGPVAVVTGAWHLPALRRRVAAADDRALLKGLPKTKVTATWVPWTDTRLATASGYGAGVASPGWYAHLWTELTRADGGDSLSPRTFTARWQSRVAGLLRENGRPASTAAVIEAARLAEALAALRDMALPGLDEMREASLATLCQGEVAPWRLIQTRLVTGSAVGEIDQAVPQMPLQADLARWQKKLKLKPEALERDLSLDLRSESGLARSLLLHRLALIDVPWGRLVDAGSSRGTFRENWRLAWQPELTVKLAEALIYGTTIEQAAGNAAVAAARKAPTLGRVSEAVKGCLLAGLDEAARVTISLLQGAAAATSDIGALAGAIPPLATILRYGTAREMPAEELRLLVTSLAEAVCSGLVYACRSLQPEEAAALRTRLAELDQAVLLIESGPVAADWRRALRRLADDGETHAILRGFAVRRLYDQGEVSGPEAGRYLSRALSRAVPPTEAGHWLDGFLGEAGQILLYDTVLVGLIDAWLCGLDQEDFTALLPMLRRAFSGLDRSERRRLFDSLRQPSPAAARAIADGGPAPVEAPSAASGFEAALPLLLTILGLDAKEKAT